MNLAKWALRWGVGYAAVEDLKREIGVMPEAASGAVSGASEEAVQNRVRLEATRKGLRLWRNNVGACVDERGNYLRYGLANDSKRMNALVKSSDLIGIRPMVVKQHHVGVVVGQFVAREIKHGGWSYTGTEREEAQLRFIKHVLALGGDAAFANNEGTL